MTYMFAPPAPADVSGHDETVILLHGSASSSAQWRSLTGWLEGRYHVVAPDLPGYGKSAGATGEKTLTLEEISQTLRPFFEKARGPVHLVGHSFGGAVALKAAGMFAGLVSSLTLLEPAAMNIIWAGSGMGTSKTADFLTAVRNSQVALAEGDAWNGTRNFIDFWNGAGAWERTGFRLRQKLVNTVAQVHRDFAALVLDQTIEPDASRVDCPVLCITGSGSPSVMKDVVQALAGILPQFQHSTVQGAGHMLPLTDPHLVDPMIGRFLAKTATECQSNAIAA